MRAATPPSRSLGVAKRNLGVSAASAGGLALLCSTAIAPALAACNPAGPLINSGATVTCDSSSIQTGRIGNGPNGAPAAGNNVTVNVNDGATIAVTNTNAISLGNNAIITIGSIAGTAVTTVQTTTNNGADSGEYGKGDNTIEFNNNSIVTIYANGQVIARGTEQTAEAINPIGAGIRSLTMGSSRQERVRRSSLKT